LLKGMKVAVIFIALLLTQPIIVSFLHSTVAGQFNPFTYPGNWCLSFDGKDDYVKCGSPQVFKQQNLTLEAWVKPKYPVQYQSYPNYYSESNGIIMCYQSNDGTYLGNTGWWLQFDYANGPLTFGWRYLSDYSWEYRSYSTSKAIWLNTSWYQIVVTFDNGNLKFYVNGTLDSQDSDSHGIRYDGSSFQIGGFQSSNFTGLIDEVRVWNVSKSQSEISNTWRRILNSTEVKNPNLIGYWRFDDGSGTYAHDSSIQGNDGILLPYSDPPQWIPVLIPEFSLYFILPLFVMVTFFAIIVYKRKAVQSHNTWVRSLAS
jgi:hypothetical protein